jgi:hypothetical protein
VFDSQWESRVDQIQRRLYDASDGGGVVVP